MCFMVQQTLFDGTKKKCHIKTTLSNLITLITIILISYNSCSCLWFYDVICGSRVFVFCDVCKVDLVNLNYVFNLNYKL
jgi:hypothetical protein